MGGVKKKQVIILYCSSKGGHRYPSLALYDYLKNEKHAEVRLFNLLDYLPIIPFFDRVGRFGDLALPGLYRKSYRSLQREDRGFTQLYKKSIRSILTAPFAIKRILSLVNCSDVVISIQPEINVLARDLTNHTKAQFHTIIIDYAIHRLWINPGISTYYVGNPELANELRRIGVPSEKVVVSGIPVRKGFLDVMNKDKKDVRSSLGLERDLYTLLLVCGLLGTMMDFKKVLTQLASLEIPFQAMVVFGENKRAFSDCSDITSSSKWPIHSYGRVENMDEMMWASDVVISKPGSVTIAEILSHGKPSILISPKAGSAQELAFGDYVQRNKAGIFLQEPTDVGKSLEGLLSDNNLMQEMSERAYMLGLYNRQANRVISENILKP